MEERTAGSRGLDHTAAMHQCSSLPTSVSPSLNVSEVGSSALMISLASAIVFALLYLFGVSLNFGLVGMTIAWSIVAIALRAAFLMLLERWHGSSRVPPSPPPGSATADAPLPRAASEESQLLAGAHGPPPALPMPPDPDDAFEIQQGAGGNGSGGGGPKGALTQGVCSARLIATLCHRANLAVVGFMVALNLTSAFYLQTQAEQMSLLFDEASATTIAHFLEFGFPIVGFISSIAAAHFVFERHHDHELMCWAWPIGLGLGFLVVQMVPLLPFQYLAAVLFGPMRTVCAAL